MKLLALLTFSILMVGCASGQHTYTKDGTCIRCMNNPFTGKPVNYDPAVDSPYSPRQLAAQEQEATHSAGSIGFEVPYSVEHAYYVVQREFSFPTPLDDEFHRAKTDPIDPEIRKRRNRNFDVPTRFRYAQGFRQHGDVYLVIGTKIQRIDHRTSKITISYLSDDPSLEVWDMSRSLRERVLSALEYYGCDSNINRDYDNRYRYSDPC